MLAKKGRQQTLLHINRLGRYDASKKPAKGLNAAWPETGRNPTSSSALIPAADQSSPCPREPGSPRHGRRALLFPESQHREAGALGGPHFGAFSLTGSSSSPNILMSSPTETWPFTDTICDIGDIFYDCSAATANCVRVNSRSINRCTAPASSSR
jgi:hypothetical protein